MRRALIIASLVAFCLPGFPQKVAVVFSGGGAKGLAHIGVLKALEENEIPIDFLVGTSMGGIVAGCYAIGMSPDEIERMVLSDEFQRWVNGVPEKGFNYFYHRSNDDPHFIKVNLSLDSTFSVHFNTSIASDVSLNFALAEKTAQAAAISGNNFDSLFVPIRLLAADVFTQKEVVISEGLLSEALRTTQTVPFFYNPIRFQGKYLFDGGIYNNFPVDVAIEEFDPDIVIGSNVSSKTFSTYPYDNDDELVNHSLLYMLLDKSDPEAMPEGGVYIQPDLTAYTAFDFDKVKNLIDSGYRKTLSLMPEIKARVTSRTSCETLTARRNMFHGLSHQMRFSRLEFDGFNKRQERYIEGVFKVHHLKDDYFYFEDVKQGYFRLVSEEFFNSVYPNILYDSSSDAFKLKLSKRPQKNFQVGFGAAIVSRNISNIYLGADYYHFNRTLTHAFLGVQSGSFLKSIVMRARIDYPFLNQIYLQPQASFTTWDYLESEDLLRHNAPTVLKRADRNVMVEIGKPLGDFFRAAVVAEGINNMDRYANLASFASLDTLDNLKLHGFKFGIQLTSERLNRKQYPSLGRSVRLAAKYFDISERYQPGSTSAISGNLKNNYHWFSLSGSIEQYFNRGWFRPGYCLKANLSNQPTFSNYYGTVINAPGFFPLQDSRSLVLENFRAFNYVAGGIRNVFVIKPRLDFRLEGYVFRPIEYLMQGADDEAFLTTNLQTAYFAGTAGFVLHSPVGPIAASFNYYDDPQNRFGLMLHVGYLLFPHHSFE